MNGRHQQGVWRALTWACRRRRNGWKIVKLQGGGLPFWDLNRHQRGRVLALVKLPCARCVPTAWIKGCRGVCVRVLKAPRVCRWSSDAECWWRRAVRIGRWAVRAGHVHTRSRRAGLGRRTRLADNAEAEAQAQAQDAAVKECAHASSTQRRRRHEASGHGSLARRHRGHGRRRGHAGPALGGRLRRSSRPLPTTSHTTSPRPSSTSMPVRMSP